MIWAQKARSNWILQGDRNLSSFRLWLDKEGHKIESSKSRMIKGALLKILMKLRPSSLIILGLAFRIQFNQVLIALFRNFNPFLYLLFPLNKPIIASEIEEFVFQIGAHKAPRPDGIPAFFFQKYWGTVKSEVISTILTFFHSGSLFKPLNQNFITLIPKIPFPKEVSHFRPICLCNVVYKIISKVLVNRLKPLIDSIITLYQNAFIKGRNISDNIIISPMRSLIH